MPRKSYENSKNWVFEFCLEKTCAVWDGKLTGDKAKPHLAEHLRYQFGKVGFSDLNAAALACLEEATLLANEEVARRKDVLVEVPF